MREPALVAARESGTSATWKTAEAVAPATRSAVATSHMPTAKRAEAVDWYVRPEGGGQYGPADESLLRQWIHENRVDADALVWREDWPEWRRAGDVFAELAKPQQPAALPSFADIPDLSQISGKGPGSGVTSVDPAHPAARRTPAPNRRGRLARSSRPGKDASKRLVVLLSLMVMVLAVALVLIVVYFGQN
jgi:hypothetical protein